MRVVYCGSRHWNDPHAVYAVLEDLQHRFPNHVVVHGKAKGLDHMVDCIARRLGLTPEPHPALWEQFGRGAGPRRNYEMLSLGADLIVAFKEHVDMDYTLGKGGTEHMMRIALRRHVPVVHFPSCTAWRCDPTGKIVFAEERSLLALMERAALL